MRQGLNALNENTIVKVVLIGLEMKKTKGGNCACDREGERDRMSF